MANTHAFETRFSKAMQATFYNQPVFREITDPTEKATLTEGQVLTRVRKPLLVSQRYTRGSNLSPQTLTEASENLTVDIVESPAFSLDRFDEIQSNYNLMQEYADDAMKALNDIIDAEILAQYGGAEHTLDDGDFGGTDGNGIALSSSNILQVFHKANQKLRQAKCDITGVMRRDPAIDKKFSSRGQAVRGRAKGFGALSPNMMYYLDVLQSDRETNLGDEVLKNGFNGNVLGTDLYLTANLSESVVLGLATLPTNTDTLTIDGVTVTFVSSIGTAAGNVLIAGTVDATRINLAGLINNPTTTSANQVAVSSTRSDNVTLSDSEKFDRLTATDSPSGDTLTIVAKGVDFIVVASNLTDGTDGWSKEIQHNMIGRRGAIDIIMQDAPKVHMSDIPLQFGKYIKPAALFGRKVFSDGAKCLVDVQIDVSELS